VEDYHAYGPVAGLDRFLTRVVGPDWRAVMERALPGAAEQMEQDTGTFFATDIPALLAWTFGAEDARRITQAVLHIGGSESGQFFAALAEFERDLIRERTSAGLAAARARGRHGGRPSVDDHSKGTSGPGDVPLGAVHGRGDRHNPGREPRLDLPPPHPRRRLTVSTALEAVASAV
jgi:Resolvase, N terminal domain